MHKRKNTRIPMKLRRLRRVLLLAVVCSWAPLTGAQTTTQAVRATGKALYESHCAFCHGVDGSANTPIAQLLQTHPRNFADPVEMSRLSDDEIYRAIKEGRPGTAMPAWGQVLNELQIGDVMDFIRTLTPPRPPSLTGERLSIENGRRIYKKDCAECHGKTGHADTDAAKVLRPRPRKFADPVEMARVDDGRMYAAIKLGRPGTSMGGWGGLLNPAEIIDVMRYVRTLTEPLPAVVTKKDLDVMVGERIYKENCTGCHGIKGDANTALGRALIPRPRNFTNPKEMANLDRKKMIEAVTHGKPGTAMAPWNGILNPEDIRRVTLYIQQTFEHKP